MAHLRPGGPTSPKHPGGEYAVEQRLDEGGAEECRAALALEADSERLLQSGADSGQCRRVAGSLYAGESVAGIGGEEPGEVLGFEKSGIVGQRSAEILTQTGANLTGEGAGLFKQAVEVFGAVGEPEGLQSGRPAGGIRSEQGRSRGCW